MNSGASSISISTYGAPADREGLEKLEEAGVERAIFGLPSAERDKVEPVLDHYAKLMA